MKKIVINLFVLILLCFQLHAQIKVPYGPLMFVDTLGLRPLNSCISIPDSLNNIWKVAIPEKAYFDTGYSDSIAILTDSMDYYANNCNDYFTISISAYGYTIIGEGILSFYHKFDTDTLLDGGVIEISYDEGNTWINIKDNGVGMSSEFIGLYEDTISGGVYGFSGKSDGWQYVELYWHWNAITGVKSGSRFYENPILRFRFVSDDQQTNKEGWMIDDLIFRAYAPIGDVKEFNDNDLQIFPNPVVDYITIRSKSQTLDGFLFTLYDMYGKIIKQMQVEREWIDLSDVHQGVYICKLQKENRIMIKKLVKN
ncbi:MAG TPA: T9SS type A sorting domain-containing protein [Bacteroidales bacterium]|jgi:hypothetical protein|nr:T9SS type A sorting domain-containing protein [Bacteroidales bacterium]HOS17230.1 T9SS type A sorting domain-containing protein [Bacteroidales bacterium]